MSDEAAPMRMIVALHRAPAKIETFIAGYRDTHLPRAARIPGLVRVELIPVTPTALGTEGNYLRAELYFTETGFAAALASPELAAFAHGLVTPGASEAGSA